MAAAALTTASRLPDSVSLIFNRGWAGSVGVVGMCVCVRVFSVGGTALSLFFYCTWMGGGRKQLRVGLWSLMMFVGRCVCVSVFVQRRGRFALRSKPFEVLNTSGPVI